MTAVLKPLQRVISWSQFNGARDNDPDRHNGTWEDLAKLLTTRVEDGARALGYHVLNLDVRETQTAAIALYEQLGYQRWGIHPAYARVRGATVRGIFFYKTLQTGSRIA